ncbi:VOC family protein [Candidatus Poribacteria bacterium]|nr:VOC family protein [Candidatus Poribacteria bacterium]
MSAITWFEIPVVDMERAKKFYSEVLDIEFIPYDTGEQPMSMVMFPDRGGVGGALVQNEQGYVPSQEGSIVYLFVEDDLNIPLGRVEKAGGKVLMPKMDTGGHGFAAWMLDSEGNRVGLHSMK